MKSRFIRLLQTKNFRMVKMYFNDGTLSFRRVTVR